MSLSTVLNEIWRFIKENKYKILIGSLVFSVLVVVSQVLPIFFNRSNEEAQSGLKDVNEEIIDDSHNYLLNIYQQEPAEFEIFVQLEDGNGLGNSFIFDEYFTSQETVEKVENKTGIDYGDTLEYEKNLGLYKTSQYRGSIASIRDTSTNIFTIRIQVAENEEDNLELANEFINMIQNDEIPFLENLKVTILRGPEIGESLLENQIEMVSSPIALDTFSLSESSENNSIFLYVIAGFIVGILITIVILFIIQMFKKRINYAFQYSWDFNDYHIIYSTDEDKKNQRLVSWLLYPENTTKKIISQNNIFIDYLIKNHEELDKSLFTSQLTINSSVPDEVIFLIKSKETEKEWYNQQYRLAELYNSQIKIVHIID